MNIGVKLSRIQMEDYIWFVYLFIIFAALASNNFEKEYVLTKDLESQKKFKTINIVVFTIAIFIYLYFVIINYHDFNDYRKELSKKEVITREFALVAALLFLIGGIINLIIEINRDTEPVDVGII